MHVRRTMIVPAAALALLFSGCSNPGETANGGNTPADGTDPLEDADLSGIDVESVEPVPQIADMLPEAVRERGSLRVGIAPGSPPLKYMDEEGELTGAEVELYEAVARVLDIDIEFSPVSFDSLQPGIESGRYDFAGMADTLARQEAMNFIDIHEQAFGIVAHPSFEEDELEDYRTAFCGHSVGVLQGAVAQQINEEISADCEARGEDPVESSAYSTTGAIALAVKSQQTDFGFFEAPSALAYVEVDPDGFKVVAMEDRGGSYYSGTAFAKDNEELLEAVRAGMLHLAEEGLYQEIFEGYGISALLWPDFTVNASTV